MSDVLSNGPSPPPSAGADPRVSNAAPSAPDVACWLGRLLHVARDRRDHALSRLIAGVIHDLKAAKG